MIAILLFHGRVKIATHFLLFYQMLCCIILRPIRQFDINPSSAFLICDRCGNSGDSKPTCAVTRKPFHSNLSPVLFPMKDDLSDKSFSSKCVHFNETCFLA